MIGVIKNGLTSGRIHGATYPCTVPVIMPIIVPAINPLHVTPSPIQRLPFESLFPKSSGVPPPKAKAPPFEKYAGRMKYNVVKNAIRII